jgi:hypothetical protein
MQDVSVCSRWAALWDASELPRDFSLFGGWAQPRGQKPRLTVHYRLTRSDFKLHETSAALEAIISSPGSGYGVVKGEGGYPH